MVDLQVDRGGAATPALAALDSPPWRSSAHHIVFDASKETQT